jgi:hypothetical protein
MPEEEEPLFQYTLVFRARLWEPNIAKRLINTLEKEFSILHTDIRSHYIDPRTGKERLHRRPEIVILSHVPNMFDRPETPLFVDKSVAEIKTEILPDIPEGITPKHFREERKRGDYEYFRLFFSPKDMERVRKLLKKATEPKVTPEGKKPSEVEIISWNTTRKKIKPEGIGGKFMRRVTMQEIVKAGWKRVPTETNVSTKSKEGQKGPPVEPRSGDCSVDIRIPNKENPHSPRVEGLPTGLRLRGTPFTRIQRLWRRREKTGDYGTGGITQQERTAHKRVKRRGKRTSIRTKPTLREFVEARRTRGRRI